MAARLVRKRSVAMIWKIPEFAEKVYYRRTDFNCHKMFEKLEYKYPVYFIIFYVVYSLSPSLQPFLTPTKQELCTD